MRCRLPVRRVPRLPRRGSGDGVPFPLGRFTWARAGPSGRPGEMLAVSSGVSEELVITWDVCGGARSGDPLCPAGVTLIVTEALLWSPLLPALGGEGPCPQAEQVPAPARASGPPGAGLAPVGACVQRPGPPPSPTLGGAVTGQVDVRLPGSRRTRLGPASWAFFAALPGCGARCVSAAQRGPRRGGQGRARGQRADGAT